MTTLIICLFIACLLPYLAKIPMVIAIKEQASGYDNHHPRAQQASLTGFGARAVAGHQNSFESLIIFSTAVLTAIATQHLGMTIQLLAVFHIVARVVYHVLYVMNWASLRSMVWGLGILSSFAILLLCLY